MSRSDQNSLQPFRTPDCREHYPLVAAIDLGTNSCRLLIVRVNLAGVRSNYFRSRPRLTSWKVVDSYAKVIRLGEGLSGNNTLLPAAIDRAVEALSMCRRKLDRFQVETVRIVATEACRRADNVGVLVNRVESELGLNIEVISSEEEGQLALKGCAAILDPLLPYGIVFDIGGGSTEVVWIRLLKEGKRRSGFAVSFEVLGSVSLPFGVVTTSEDLSKNDTPETQQEIYEEICNQLKTFIDEHDINTHLNRGEVQILGSSGTVTTLAVLHLGLSQYDRRMIDGLELGYKDLQRIINQVLNMTRQERLAHQYIGSGRVDYVVTGSIILKALCDMFPMPAIRIADRGVREGILIELVRGLLRP